MAYTQSLTLFSGVKVISGSTTRSVIGLSATASGEVQAVDQVFLFFIFLNLSADNSPYTPEKTNSRSPAPPGDLTYDDQASATTDSTGALIVAGHCYYSYNRFIFQQRYVPVVINGTSSPSFGTRVYNNTSASTATFTIIWDVGDRIKSARRCRRSRSAIFNLFGNFITRHAKTGGGAFSTITPHFDHDVTWIDRVASANAWAPSSQSSVWSIQQFGEPAAVVASNQFLLLGVG